MGIRTLAQLLLWTAEDYEHRLEHARLFTPLCRYLNQNALRLPTADELTACRESFWVELGVPIRRLRVRRCDLPELPLRQVLCLQPTTTLAPVLQGISTVGRLSDFTTLDIRNLWLRSIQGQRIGRGSNQPLTQADYGQAAQLTDLFLTLLDQSGLAELGFSLKVLI